MSGDEMEKFEITDYDLNNESYGGRKKLSKQQQIYGIWADASDNDEDERPSFKSRKPKNYSAPIGFVAGGVQQGGRDKVKREESDSDGEKPTTSFKARNSSSEDDITMDTFS